MISSILGNAIPDFLGLGIVTKHPISTERRGNCFHLEVDATVFLLGFDYLLACGGFKERGALFARWDAVRSRVRGVAGEGLCSFQFDKQFDVALVDLKILFVESVGERPTATVLDMLEL